MVGIVWNFDAINNSPILSLKLWYGLGFQVKLRYVYFQFLAFSHIKKEELESHGRIINGLVINQCFQFEAMHVFGFKMYYLVVGGTLVWDSKGKLLWYDSLFG